MVGLAVVPVYMVIPAVRFGMNGDGINLGWFDLESGALGYKRSHPWGTRSRTVGQPYRIW
jgi:hypothetical protein